METEVAQKKFFSKVTALSQREDAHLCFVLGNGTNLHFLAPTAKNVSKYSWNSLLNAVAKKMSQNSFSKLIKNSNGDIFNTELADYIELSAINKANLKKTVADVIREKYIVKWKNQQECPLLDFALRNGHILTTNFDYNIEDYFEQNRGFVLEPHTILFDSQESTQKKNKKAKSSEEAKQKTLKTIYQWNHFRSSASYTSENLDSLQQDIWHIHGVVNGGKSSSILFSSAEYAKAITYFERMKAKNENKTWLKFFLHSPLIFVGLTLSPQEIFLRHLLLERFRRKNDFSMVFYLFTKEEKLLHESGGNKFISMLGGTNIEFDSYDDLYNNENWNKYPTHEEK